MKLLIVDDSDVISKRLNELLQDINGLEIVGIAKDGLQAISEFNNLEPDIVVLDLMIPQMNGLDVLRNIRLHDKAVIVIILTNYHQSYFRDLSSELGANYFLDKSGEFEKVYQICFNILNPKPNNNTDYLLLNHKEGASNG
jgi:two-component system chemotaxis response regulator CheB